MSNKDNPVKAAPAGAVDPVQEVTLAEYCRRLSETVRRPELISAFEHRMRTAGVMRDTVEAFRGRYDAFVTTPV